MSVHQLNNFKFALIVLAMIAIGVAPAWIFASNLDKNEFINAGWSGLIGLLIILGKGLIDLARDKGGKNN